MPPGYDLLTRQWAAVGNATPLNQRAAVHIRSESSPATVRLRTGTVALIPVPERILVVGKCDASALSRLSFVRQVHAVASGVVLYVDAGASVKDVLFAAGEGALFATVFYRLGRDLWAPNGRLVAKVKDESRAAGAVAHARYVFEKRLAGGICCYMPEPNTLSLPLSAAKFLWASGAFDYVEPDGVWLVRNAGLSANDSLYARQWNHKNDGTVWNGVAGADMRVNEAWELTRGNDTIRIAVPDDGVDLNHPDLKANLLPGYDGTDEGSAGGATGDDAHGTACAGIIAAVADNGIGVAGVAPVCKIIPVRIARQLAPNDYFYTTTGVVEAIRWTVDVARPHVASLSLAFPQMLSAFAYAFEEITRALSEGRGGLGIPVFAAAANDDTAHVAFGPFFPDVIAVGASSMCDERKSPVSCDGESWWGSNYGTYLSILAPGVKIPTTDRIGPAGYRSGDYTDAFNGTSSATPNAAAVAALVLSVHPRLTRRQVRDIIERTADKVGGYDYRPTEGKPNGTWHPEAGYGRVNARAAVQAALDSLNPVSVIPSRPSFFSVYPNPARDKLIVRLWPLPEPSYKLKISDIAGKVVWAGHWDEEAIDVSFLPAGMYVLKLGEDKFARFSVFK
jgi:subtilisin family serine protease